MNAELVEWFERCSTRRRLWNIGGPYHQLHPKVVFLKNLPENARMLDVGAGDGNMAVFKGWLEPLREDIRLDAISLAQGQNEQAYERWVVAPWNRELDLGEGRYDAIFASHFIEHIDDPVGFLVWSHRHLKAGGLMYLEWPTPAARTLSPRTEVHRTVGVMLSISNYFDDHTHRPDMPTPDAIARSLIEVGFAVQADATISMPFFEDKLLEEHFVTEEPFLAQAAYWLKTGWCHHIVARKKKL